MKFREKSNTLLCFFLCLICANCHAKDFFFRSQTSAWFTSNKANQQLGFRYLPELSYQTRISNTYELSGEAAGNATWHSDYRNLNHKKTLVNIDPYRLWLRLSAPQHELRIGLQKINFGSATLLRPLRWFDSLDPRDPLKLTDGVYGFLGRYYFLNNANVWLWALSGNDRLKGWETVASNKRRVEFGGRVQVPVKSGEMGFSFHRRRVNINGQKVSSIYPAAGDFTEQIFALDGKWDVGVGLWFEGAFARQEYREPNARYKSLLTLGTDYTFAVGESGLHILFEELMSVESRNPFSDGETRFVSGFLADYPLNLLDTVSTVVYYDQEQDEWSRFLTWRRTYDQWQINISAFWNPENSTQGQSDAAINSLAGSGLQIMFVFNN